MTASRFAKYAWFVVAYNILVILWGAFVRATGSGAGCGSHWPLCNGEVIPVDASIERMIEFTHRGMSGIALALVAIMVYWAFRAFPAGRIRTASIASGVFIVLEAAIGATIVLMRLTGIDQSTERVISISLHLVNTFLLLTALTLTAWWASGGKPIDLRANRLHTYAMAIGLIGLLLTGAAGALTALGDTLFPAASLAEGLQQDANPGAHFLVQLRVVHPSIAVIVAMYLLYLTVMLNGKRGSQTRSFAMTLRFLVVGQVLAGSINLVLLAPTYMQILHLLLADLVWIVMVLYAASLLGVERETAPAATTTRPMSAPAE